MRLKLTRPRRWAAAASAALTLALTLLPAAAPAAAHDKGYDGGLRPKALRVGRPVSYKNLTLFPVYGGGARLSTSDYVTLDEGIRAGTVTITERGSLPPSALIRTPRGVVRQQQASMRGDGASVNELALINKSGKKLLLLAGEVIVGGRQDRIVQDDLVVPPVSVPISLNVFCVEHGRWSQRADTSDVSAPAPVIAPAREARKAENFYSLGAVAHPKLRAAAQDKREQTEVWKEVSANNERLGTKTGTDTYQQVYASREVAGSVESYVRALERELTGPDVVGVVVARNGELVWSDVFATPQLFARYWPKLLKSYAVEALSDQTSERRPTEQEATRYLYARDGQARRDGRAGVYELVRVENPRYAVFELWDTSLAAPARLHFNKAQR